MCLFRRVETEQDHLVFESIWKKVATEKHFTFDLHHHETIRYFIQNETDIVGTIEFMKYNPNVYSTFGNDFTISKFPVIEEHQETVWEVDKVCILKKWRGRGYLQHAFHAMAHHAKLYEVSHYIALIERFFYHTLRLLTRYPLQKLGEPFLIEGEKRKVVPCLLDAQQALLQFEKDLQLFHRIPFIQKS